MFWFFRSRQEIHPKSQQDNRKKIRKPRRRKSGTGRDSSRQIEVITFGDREVRVERRPYKRSIGLTLQINGHMRISAPKTTTVSQIHEFLSANTNWIETNLAKYSTLRAAYPRKRFVEGEAFLFLGETLTLKFTQGTGARLRFDVSEGFLVVAIPPLQWASFRESGSHPELEPAFHEFYAKRGRQIIGSRLEIYSERMGLRPSSVCFRSQKTRWGSCSSRGRLSFNWRLVIAPIEVIDYVVVHELAHLKHYDHSRAFWNLVGTQLPHYPRQRDWLKANQYEADFLAKRSELHP